MHPSATDDALPPPSPPLPSVDAALIEARLAMATVSSPDGDPAGSPEALSRAIGRIEAEAARWPPSTELTLAHAAELIKLAEIVARVGRIDPRQAAERAVALLEPVGGTAAPLLTRARGFLT